jgi:hypothetical protein
MGIGNTSTNKVCFAIELGDIQTDHLPPNPPNSGSLLLDWTITSPVQQSFLASNTNLRNCKPFKQPSTAKSTNTRTFSSFNPLALSSLHSLSNPSVVPTPKFATFFNSSLNVLPDSRFFPHYNPMPPLSPTMLRQSFVLTHVGTANFILEFAKKANTSFQLAAGTSSILPFPFNFFFAIFSFCFS